MEAIQYLTYQQIDKIKWDACIDQSSQPLIYAYSFYLDAMAKQWDALVLNDYEAVMPLTWNKKYGIHYLYQPFCCALLGVFGHAVTPSLLEHFIGQIPKKFLYLDICFNPGNSITNSSIDHYTRKNFILNLARPYDEIYAGFSDNIKRNIKKAERLNCSVCKPALAEILQLASLQMQAFTKVKADDFERFSALYHVLEEKNAAVAYGIVSAEGRLLSSCVFFNWQNRWYYILAGNHPESKSTGASHALINAFIKERAATNCILDFEGSDIASLALFYSSFGAAEEQYPAIRQNRLPMLLRWLKK